MEGDCDILKAIEKAVSSELSRDPSLTGKDIFQAYEALLISCLAEQSGRGPILPRSESAQRLFRELERTCGFLSNKPGQFGSSRKAREELIRCLNELIKTSRSWKSHPGMPDPFRDGIEYT